MTLPKIATSMSAEEGTKLAELATGKTVLELGAYYGFSTVAMAQVATVVHSVDWHKGDPHAGSELTLPGFMANLEAYGVAEKVVTHVGRIIDVLPMLHPRSFDFAFHDAYHETLAVFSDATFLFPLMRPGSLVAFHDWHDERFGVTDAIDQLLAGGRWEWIENVGSLAVLRV